VGKMLADGVGGQHTGVIINTLKFYANAGMIKFPVKAWLLDDDAKKQFGSAAPAPKAKKVKTPKIDVDDDLNSFTV